MVNGESSCPDFVKAPQGFCKHRLAYGIHKRAYMLAKAKLEQCDDASNGQATPASQPSPALSQGTPVTPAQTLPEAPASCNVYVTLAGHKVQVTFKDRDEQRLLARLEALLNRFPAEDEPKPSRHSQKAGVASMACRCARITRRAAPGGAIRHYRR